MKSRLSLRQWFFFHSKRRFLVLTGGRMTGKSYVINRYAIHQMAKGKAVLYVAQTGVSCKYKFDELMAIIREHPFDEIHFFHPTRKISDMTSKGLIRFIPAEYFKPEELKYFEKFDIILWDEPLHMHEAIARVRVAEAGLHRRFERVRLAGTIADWLSYQKTKSALRKGEKLAIWRLSRRIIKKLLENS